MYLPFKVLIFQCHVSFRGCNTEVKINMPYVEAKLAAEIKTLQQIISSKDPPKKMVKHILAPKGHKIKLQEINEFISKHESWNMLGQVSQGGTPSKKQRTPRKSDGIGTITFQISFLMMSCCCGQFKLRGGPKKSWFFQFRGPPKKKHYRNIGLDTTKPFMF